MKKELLSAAFLFVFCFMIEAQQVMLQGWYWDYPKTADGHSWADTLTDKAADLANAGFTHVWFPPHTVASFGNGSNGYDPQDLFIGNTTTGLGTRAKLDAMLSAFTAAGIDPVADMIYNHRDGGRAEHNPGLESYIQSFNSSKNPFPSDRMRVILPLGSGTSNGTGDYYIKISSITTDSKWHNKPYTFYAETNTKGFQELPALSESEPNGGGDCNQLSDDVELGRDMMAFTDDNSNNCYTDEFKLTLQTVDFNPTGDTLYIYLTNSNGDYSDHRIYSIWNASASQDVANQLIYQTYTDFSNLPSGRGKMDWNCFKPNNTNSTSLTGEWDIMYFFYDYDQFTDCVRDTLFKWTEWNWEELGVRGLRMDAIKHFTPTFVGDLLDYMHDLGYDPSLVVGEWYGTNTAELSGWVNDVLAAMDEDTKAAIAPKIFDFSLRESLRQACDQFGYDARGVFSSSLRDAAGMSGFNIVTFVNNHDFRDENGFASLVKNDPILPYVYILTNNQLGVPTVFYPDYYGGPAIGSRLPSAQVRSGTALKPEIDALIKLQQDYIFGANQVDYLSRIGTPYTANYSGGFPNTSLIYQLSGGIAGREVIVAINFAGEDLNVDHEINMSNVIAGETFTDLTGNAATTISVLDGSNRLNLNIPARSYAVWVEGDLSALPVELLTFSGDLQEDIIELFWTVNNQINIDEYIVQHSDNGKEYKDIGRVKSKALGIGLIDYRFPDRNPNFGNNFYRLKIIESNGSLKYSNVISIPNDRNIDINIFPNPFREELQIDLSESVSEILSVELFDISGSLIQPIKLDSDLILLDMGELSSGVYFVKIVTRSGISQHKLIKN